MGLENERKRGKGTETIELEFIPNPYAQLERHIYGGFIYFGRIPEMLGVKAVDAWEKSVL